MLVTHVNIITILRTIVIQHGNEKIPSTLSILETAEGHGANHFRIRCKRDIQVSTCMGTRSVIRNAPTPMSANFKITSIVSLCVIRMLHALMVCGIQRSCLIFVTEVEYF